MGEDFTFIEEPSHTSNVDPELAAIAAKLSP
jgi:hypothetical protein